MFRSVAGIAVSVLLLTAACGGSGSGPDLSEAGKRGRAVARENGCAACHGVDGEGGVGPPLVGLAGSNVELADGSTVVADSEYLVRAIIDPAAELVAGYDIRMPSNSLSGSQVADVIAYIEDLSGAAGS